MRTITYASGLLMTAILLVSCSGRTSSEKARLDSLAMDSLDFEFPVHFDYARTISVVNHPSYKEVVTFAPEGRDTLAVYILYPRSSEPPTPPRPSDILIPVPVERLGCLSTVQLGTLPLLDRVDCLVGCAKPENVNSPEIRQRIQEGKVVEIARGMSENVERILSVRPEVILQDFSRMDEQDEEMRRAGIVPVLFNSWKEYNLLGRAEWLKLSGLLLGANRRADSLFRQVEENYHQVRQIAQGQSDTIHILYGLDWKGQWYIPGEYSYATSMLRDAALRFDYIPGEVNSTPVSFEYVYSRHRHAKIWLSVMTGIIRTKEEFLSLNERYTYFDAGREGGTIFLDRKRVNEHGGNDYWESGPYRPDLILKDLIKITRPHLLPDYETTYFVQLY